MQRLAFYMLCVELESCVVNQRIFFELTLNAFVICSRASIRFTVLPD